MYYSYTFGSEECLGTQQPKTALQIGYRRGAHLINDRELFDEDGENIKLRLQTKMFIWATIV